MALRPVELHAPTVPPPRHPAPADPSEVRGLLNQLAGAPVVSVTGELDEAARARLAMFQASHGLPETGEPDRATVSALRREADRATQARSTDDATSSPTRAPSARLPDITALALQTGSSSSPGPASRAPR